MRSGEGIMKAAVIHVEGHFGGKELRLRVTYVHG